MKTTQGNMLASLRNVQNFCQANAATLASIDTAIKERLGAAIVTLSGHALDQNKKFIEAKGSTQTQESLRSELLKFHMAPINRVAKLELGNTPELTPFLMPKGGRQTIEKLKSFADGMAAAAEKYSATFIAAGLPADFITQCNAVSTAMVEAQGSRAQTSAERKGATTSLRSMLTLGRRIVHVLDPLVQQIIHNDPGLLTIWNTVKRVPRTGSNATAAATAPATPAATPPAAAIPAVSTPVVTTPATPAVSTPAAAQQSHTPTT